jgi:hypothetical protein
MTRLPRIATIPIFRRVPEILSISTGSLDPPTVLVRHSQLVWGYRNNMAEHCRQRKGWLESERGSSSKMSEQEG